MPVHGQLGAPEGNGGHLQVPGGGGGQQSHGRIMENQSGGELDGIEGKQGGNPRFFTSLSLSNQCIYFLNHLSPAPFSLAHQHGCGPGHHHLSPRLLPGSGRSLAAQDPDPLHPSPQSQRKRQPVFTMSVPVPVYQNPKCPLLTGHSPNSLAQHLGCSSGRGGKKGPKGRSRKRSLVVKENSLEKFTSNGLYFSCRAEMPCTKTQGGDGTEQLERV